MTGIGTVRTMESDAQHLKHFQSGARSLDCAGVIREPWFKVEPHNFVVCILHMTMRIGIILGEYIQLLARALSAKDKHDLLHVLRQVRLPLEGSVSLKGDQVRVLFKKWPELAAILRPSEEAHAAVCDMGTLLHDLYRTLYPVSPAGRCADVARRFRQHLCATVTGGGPHYLYILEHDLPAVIRAIHPLGLGVAMFLAILASFATFLGPELGSVSAQQKFS